jgi:hypothetical protein
VSCSKNVSSVTFETYVTYGGKVQTLIDYQKKINRPLFEVLGTSRQSISAVMTGKRQISYRMADSFQKLSNGELNADVLIAESIECRKKWLERKAKFS